MSARACDVSITECSGVYRIRAHTATGRAWIATLGDSFDQTLDAREIIVDELPRIPALLKPWYVVQHTKH